METGKYPVDEYFACSDLSDRETLERLREAHNMYIALTHSLMSGYSALRHKAVEAKNWNQVSYYEGMLAAAKAQLNHWIELNQ
jgi:hypothetical protein